MSAPLALNRSCRPADVAEDTLLLLESGRTGMAKATLARLPHLIRDAMQADRAEQRAIEAEVAQLKAERTRLADEVWRERRALKALEADIGRRKRQLVGLQSDPAPRTPKPHERLAEALAAGLTTPEAAAEVLRVRADAVQRIATGRSTIAATSWARLWRAIESNEGQTA